jgi:hypothetical protein
MEEISTWSACGLEAVGTVKDGEKGLVVDWININKRERNL